MPFVRFMELALYDPDGGYYRSAEARPGRGGDFLTAPELHPIFGASLAAGLREIWDRLGRPDPFVIREHGAGTGALAARHPRRPDRPGRRGVPGGHPLRAGRGRPAPHRGVRGGPRRPPATAIAIAPTGRRAVRSGSSWPTRSSTPCRSTASAGAATSSGSWRSTSVRTGAWSRPRSRRPRRPSPRGSPARASPSSTARPPRSAWPSTRWLAAATAGPAPRPRAAHRLRRAGRRAVRPASGAGTARCGPTSAIASTTTRSSTSGART